MSQPLYTVVVSSEAWPNAGSQAERTFNRGYGNDAFLTSTGGETANISPSTFAAFTSTGDQTAVYVAGRRLRIVHGSASTDTTYCEVSSAALTGASTATTVTIRNITSGATALSTALITEVGVAPTYWSTGSGNLPISTGTASSPSIPAGPYNIGMYASSSSILGWTVAGVGRMTLSGAGILELTADIQASADVSRSLGSSTARWLNTYTSIGTFGSSTPSSGVIRMGNSTAAIVGRTTNNTDDVVWPGQYASTSLGANVSATGVDSWTEVLTKTLVAGTWKIDCGLTVNGGQVAQFRARIADPSTTVYASACGESTSANIDGYSMTLAAIVSHTSAVTYVLGLSAGSTLIAAVAQTPGTVASTAATWLVAQKIG